ncbi:hypothetical protein NL676_013510 [Syzygium grande]|nr:hypothetical protein NL676_013510 [Syzygium grande]
MFDQRGGDRPAMACGSGNRATRPARMANRVRIRKTAPTMLTGLPMARWLFPTGSRRRRPPVRFWPGRPSSSLSRVSPPLKSLPWKIHRRGAPAAKLAGDDETQ